MNIYAYNKHCRKRRKCLLANCIPFFLPHIYIFFELENFLRFNNFELGNQSIHIGIELSLTRIIIPMM